MRFPSKKRSVMVLLIVAALFILPLAASATLSIPITEPNTALSVFPSPYANVTVNLTSSTTADIVFTADITGAYTYLFGDSSAVDLNVNASSFTVGSITETGYAGFTPTLAASPIGSGNVSDFGTFNLTIDNFDGFNDAAKTVSFTLTNTSGTWGADNQVLAYNNKGFVAAAHIFPWSATYDSNNKPIDTGLATGFAGNGTGGDIAVPLPPSALLLGSGLLGLGLIGWRRREKKA